jgi:hypothetical protein
MSSSSCAFFKISRLFSSKERVQVNVTDVVSDAARIRACKIFEKNNYMQIYLFKVMSKLKMMRNLSL